MRPWSVFFWSIVLGWAAFLGCGKGNSSPKPLTPDQERQVQEQLKRAAEQERPQQDPQQGVDKTSR